MDRIDDSSKNPGIFLPVSDEVRNLINTILGMEYSRRQNSLYKTLSELLEQENLMGYTMMKSKMDYCNIGPRAGRCCYRTDCDINPYESHVPNEYLKNENNLYEKIKTIKNEIRLNEQNHHGFSREFNKTHFFFVRKEDYEAFCEQYILYKKEIKQLRKAFVEKDDEISHLKEHASKLELQKLNLENVIARFEKSVERFNEIKFFIDGRIHDALSRVEEIRDSVASSDESINTSKDDSTINGSVNNDPEQSINHDVDKYDGSWPSAFRCFKSKKSVLTDIINMTKKPEESNRVEMHINVKNENKTRNEQIQVVSL